MALNGTLFYAILYNEQRIIKQAAVIVPPNTFGGEFLALSLHHDSEYFMENL